MSMNASSRSWLVRNSCANVFSAGLCAATNGGNKKKLVTATLCCLTIRNDAAYLCLAFTRGLTSSI